MLVLIDENVLGLDVPVGDGKHAEVVETSDQLVGIEFGEERRHFFLFDQLVQIVRVVLHHDVQVLVFAFRGQVAVLHKQVVRVVQHLKNSVLPVLVLPVLEDLLDGDLVSR